MSTEVLVGSGVGLLVTLLVGIVLFFNIVYTVGEQEVAIVTRFGRFVRIGRAGFNFKFPFIETIRDRKFSLKVRQLTLPVQTYTSNSVPLTIHVTVQYEVGGTKSEIGAAFFRLTDPVTQISSYVEPIVRAHATTLTFAQINAQVKDLSDKMLGEIGPSMKEFGYTILTTQIQNVDPGDEIRTQMATVVSAQYQQDAAAALGEAVRIKMSKEGEGMGDFRAKFLEKFHEGLAKFQLETLSPEDRANMYQLLSLSMTIEAWKEIGASPGTKTLFLPSPQLGGDTTLQSVLAALEAAASKQPA